MFWDVLLDALKDSAIVLPILLLVYFLIELLESKNTRKFENLKILKKRNSPILGALVGCLPQCGFSVVATDLYTKRKLSIGALIAVYIATSDEAIPILLSHPKAIKAILPLLLLKIAVAVVFGYLSQIIYDLFTINRLKAPLITNKKHSDHHDETKSVQEDVEDTSAINTESHHHHHHAEEDHEHAEENVLEQRKDNIGCCHHDIENSKFSFKHPLLHCFKVLITIFIINLIFGCIVEFGFKGEEGLASFLTQNGVEFIQPLFAMLIGFIPNCASSIVLTQLYVSGGLSFGALFAGLTVNAGLGIILLLKQNKKYKENIYIISTLIIASLGFGYLLHFIF